MRKEGKKVKRRKKKARLLVRCDDRKNRTPRLCMRPHIPVGSHTRSHRRRRNWEKYERLINRKG
jgi:hypothetical protein